MVAFGYKLFVAYLEHPQAFQLIDKKPFRCLLTYLRPALGEKDIPHRTKFQAETLSRAKAVEKKISEIYKACHIYRLCYGDLGIEQLCDFQDIPGKVSFTFDTWTSEAGDPYPRGHRKFKKYPGSVFVFKVSQTSPPLRNTQKGIFQA